ncbi:MAG: flagellar basal body-associated FliL family protein [Methylomicrobium sp.]|nr:flagellar basal body-associated FliL family protein [Methylomicrobium sp.]
MRFLLLFLGSIFSGWVLAQDAADDAQPAIEYLEMSPKFTVNLDVPRKYLLINVQLMVEGKDNMEKIKKHLPALRHELIMLYSGRNANELGTKEQREALRLESVKAVRNALDKYDNSDGFRDVFFSEFLVN